MVVKESDPLATLDFVSINICKRKLHQDPAMPQTLSPNTHNCFYVKPELINVLCIYLSDVHRE